MQFYGSGYDFSDRRWTYQAADSSQGNYGVTDLPGEVDVLIVGTGSAGLLLATQLLRFPSIKTCVIEARSGPLATGQADGLQCRSQEIFEAFGFSERVLREAYWVNEVTFWRPDEEHDIRRSDRNIDTEEGLSEFPHVILNQARLHDFFLDEMCKSKLGPIYNQRLESLEQHADDDGVQVSIATTNATGSATLQSVKARHVVGCDGARSSVRKALGLELRGDSAHAAWGVADLLVDSNFPDLRFKCIIRSRSAGSLQIIPREGGYLIRIYVEMEKLDAKERVADRGLGYDDVILAAKRIFQPYTFDIKECAWWSIYEIGQRLTDRFDNALTRDPPNVFICGDACHTHSPKAGQGMNVSMQDALNLGWKLVQTISGTADPSILKTYNEERHTSAVDLIDFDHELAFMFSGKNDVEPARFEEFFVKANRYMAGVAIQYNSSLITSSESSCRPDLASGFPLGKRFHSEEVLRVADARRIHLGHTMPADARWRILVFPGVHGHASSSSAGLSLCWWLGESEQSPVVRHTHTNADVDEVIEVKAIFSTSHADVVLESLPPILWPRKGKYGLRDYEKVFCDRWTTAKKAMPSIYESRGISRSQGCVIIVRPDQHVSAVFGLDQHQAITAFFDRFLLAKA